MASTVDMIRAAAANAICAIARPTFTHDPDSALEEPPEVPLSIGYSPTLGETAARTALVTGLGQVHAAFTRANRYPDDPETAPRVKAKTAINKAPVMSVHSGATVKLVDMDGVVHTVPEDWVRCCGVIATSIGLEEKRNDDESSSEDEETDNEIKLPTIDTTTLRHAVQFWEFHASTPYREICKPLPKTWITLLPEFDSKWIASLSGDLEQIYKLLMAANFLDDKRLLDICCAQIASLCVDKTPDQIRETFGVTDDYTLADEVEIRAENPWLEEQINGPAQVETSCLPTASAGAASAAAASAGAVSGKGAAALSE